MFVMLFHVFCIAEARASLEITWLIIRIHGEHLFDSSQTQGFVVFSRHFIGSVV